MGKGFEGGRPRDLSPLQLCSSAQPLPPGCGHRLSLEPGGDAGNKAAFLEATRQLPGCTNQHLKLLYLISLHARAAMYKDEQETWMRKNSLLALVYEAINAKVLDYDYAPEVVVIGKRRAWINTSQEASDDIDDLIKGKLLRELKTVTRTMQPVQSVQVTALGLKVAETSPAIVHRKVEAFAFYEDELLTARWAERSVGDDDSESEDEDVPLWGAAASDEEEPDEPHQSAAEANGGEQGGDTAGPVPWWEEPEDATPVHAEMVCVIETASGSVFRLSDVTKPEDVSYVGSPYLPQMLIDSRSQLQPLTDNRRRAHESAAGRSAVKDQLSEALLLGGIRLLVSEWLPFGPNQIAALNQRIGAQERCKGGMFTSERDLNAHQMHLKTTRKVCEVSIISVHPVDHVNLEAEIYYPVRAHRALDNRPP
jgi:hypothetical protein